MQLDRHQHLFNLYSGNSEDNSQQQQNQRKWRQKNHNFKIPQCRAVELKHLLKNDDQRHSLFG